MPHHSPTRGFGLLETWLASKRAATADALIPDTLRCGTLVDIGCGVPPLFVERTQFTKKIGIDIRCTTTFDHATGIAHIKHDATSAPLPLPDASADVITMLAMSEHIPYEHIPILLTDINRILRPGGLLIITSPTPLAFIPLWIFSIIGLVSKQEIDDHKQLLPLCTLTTMIESTGMHVSTTGTFEWGMNMWLLASHSSCCHREQA